MWIERLRIHKIRSFEEQRFSFSRDDGTPYQWVTLLGENGGGKSTVLQTLGLLLAGPEGAQTLVPRPVGWLRGELDVGVLEISFSQGNTDPGGSRSIPSPHSWSFPIQSFHGCVKTPLHLGVPDGSPLGTVPLLQFFVATHSPFVAAGAGEDALTLRLTLEEGVTRVEKVETPATLSVDGILQSEAFGQLSPYSPRTQAAIDRYDALARKKKRTKAEEKEFAELRAFMQQARPLGGPPEPGSLDERLDAYIEKTLRREGRG